MKFLKPIVFAGLFYISVPALAAGMLSTGPAPAQAYQSATSAQRAKPTADNKAEMAKVMAIMAKAKQQVHGASAGSNVSVRPAPSFTAKAAIPSNNLPAVTKANAAVGLPASNQVSNLSAEINTLNQVNLQFQQRVDEKLTALNTRNQFLQQRLEKLVMAMSLLNQEIEKLSQKLHMNQEASSNVQTQLTSANIAAPMTTHYSWQERLTQRFGQSASYIVVGSILLVFIILLLLFRLALRRRQGATESVTSDATQDDTKTEYDFLNTQEAIPAKLDLARAYIAMEDYNSAKTALNEVLKHGNDEQKKAAQQLFNQLT
ncbi:MAG: hypothetical protein K0U12_07730 [Gammaproteobacteria bacterium]|nr:hypothetical protein [Gammaproteobacteria bacterium]